MVVVLDRSLVDFDANGEVVAAVRLVVATKNVILLTLDEVDPT